MFTGNQRLFPWWKARANQSVVGLRIRREPYWTSSLSPTVQFATLSNRNLTVQGCRLCSWKLTFVFLPWYRLTVSKSALQTVSPRRELLSAGQAWHVSVPLGIFPGRHWQSDLLLLCSGEVLPVGQCVQCEDPVAANVATGQDWQTEAPVCRVYFPTAQRCHSWATVYVPTSQTQAVRLTLPCMEMAWMEQFWHVSCVEAPTVSEYWSD